MEITIKKSDHHNYNVVFIMNEYEYGMRFTVLGPILYDTSNYATNIVKDGENYIYTTDIKNIKIFRYVTASTYELITGDNRIREYAKGYRKNYRFDMPDIMQDIPPTQDHLTNMARYIRMSLELPVSLSVNLPYPNPKITEPFRNDISILDDGVIFKPDGVYRISFSKISDVKFEQVEKKYRDMLKEYYEQEFNRRVLILKEFMQNATESLKTARQQAIKNIVSVMDVAVKQLGYKLVYTSANTPYLKYSYADNGRASTPHAFIYNERTYELTDDDIKQIESRYGSPIRINEIYVDLTALLGHVSGGSESMVYADKNSVHVNIKPTTTFSTGMLPVCTGDLLDLDSISFIKGLVPLLDVMNLDSAYNGSLRDIIIDHMTDKKKPVARISTAEVFSTRS